MKLKALRRVAGAIVALALVFTLAAVCARRPVPATPPPPVASTTIAVLGRLQPAVQVAGRVVAPIRHELKSPAHGTVVRVLAVPGTTVREGQVLLEVSGADLALTLGHLQRQVELARARVQQLRAEVDIMPLEFTIRELELKQALLLEQEQELLLRAPRAGPLARWDLVRSGQELAPGQVVGTIFDDTAVHVVLLVSEADAPFVEPGLVALLHVEALNRELVGRVVAIDRDGVPRGERSVYAATVHVFNPGPVLGGMTVRGAIYHPGYQRSLEAWGQVSPRARAEIASSSGGIVEAVYVREGEWVRSRQLLARLVNPELSLSLARTAHQLEKARHDRAALAGGESFAVKTALAELADHEEALAATRAAVDALTLRSPGAGRVVFAARQHEPVDRGQVLAIVVDYRRLTVQARIPEADIASVAPGSPVTLYLASRPDQPHAATITGVDPEGRVGGDGVYFEVNMDPAPPGAMAGMGVRVTLDGILPPEVLLLPKEAVIGPPGATYVLVADETGTGVRRAVVTGTTDGVQVEIREGLAEGERVLLPVVAADRP